VSFLTVLGISGFAYGSIVLQNVPSDTTVPCGQVPAAATVTASSTCLSTNAIFNPSNGHYYEVVAAHLTWSQAMVQAKVAWGSVTGHLVTISSEAENNFVLGLLPTNTTATKLGGFENPSSVLNWVTGEPVTYMNWYPGEPNLVDETKVYMMGPFFGSGTAGTWTDGHDAPTSDPKQDYHVIEWDMPLPPSSGLALYYPMNANAGAAMADSSGNSHTGVVQGATYVANGKYGGAYSFDGTNDSINCGKILDIGGSVSQITAAAWFKAYPAPNGSAYTLVGKYQDPSPYTGWAIRHDPRPMADLIASYPQRAWAMQDTNYLDNQWHHMVGVFEVSTTSLLSKLYMDGVPVATMRVNGAHSSTLTTADLVVGRRSPNGSEPYHGLLDEVRVYTRSLSSTEIQALYTAVPAAPTVSLQEIVTGSCPGTVTRTWTATDACGNSTSATQVITVLAAQQTNTPLQLVGVPSDSSVACGQVPAAANVTALGGCSSGFATAMLGPSPYLSFSNSPFNGTAFRYFHLETFEDGALNTPGVTASIGGLSGPGSSGDSVDADDGSVDGSGANGRSWYTQNASKYITFTFSAALLTNLPTHVGVVWTDVGAATPTLGYGDVIFEAYDAGGALIGTNGASVGDGTGYSATAEDRFFGARFTGGISRIRFGMPNSSDWEMDHLQYGVATGTQVNVQLRETVTGSCPGTVTRTWTATDGCGVTTSATQVITVNAVPLTLVGVPPDITVACGQVPDVADVTTTSGCPMAVTSLVSGMVGQWTLNENGAGTVYQDTLGLNSLSLQPAATTSSHSTSGKVDRAAVLNGTTDWISSSGFVSITGKAPRALTFWIRTSQVGSGFMATWGQDVSGKGFGAFLGSNGRAYFWGSNQDIDSGVFVRDGNWHFVAVMYDGSNGLVYVDGSLAASQPRTLNTSLTPLNLGSKPGGVEKLAAEIDAVTIHSRALSSAEVQSVYNGGAGREDFGTSATQALPAVQFQQSVIGDCPGTFTRTWTATDGCGNTTSATQVITVNAAPPPPAPLALVGVPPDTTVACGQVPASANVAVTGGCPVTVTSRVDGLVGQWKLNENSSGTAYQDALGLNSLSLQPAAATSSHSVSGKVARAVLLNGTTDWISSSTSIAITGKAPRALTFWMRTSQLTSGFMATWGQDVNGKGFGAFLGSNGRLYFWGSNQDIDSGVFVRDGNWHFVTVMYDGSNGIVYVDGSLAVTAPRPLNTPLTPFNLGAKPGGVERLAEGIDAVTIHSRTLSAAEIQALYNGGAGSEDLGTLTTQGPPPVQLQETVVGSCPGTVTRTWSVTDGCGVSTSATQVITVNAPQEPTGIVTLVGVPANITVPCGQVPAPASVTAQSTCGSNNAGSVSSDKLVLFYNYEGASNVVPDASGQGHIGVVQGSVSVASGHDGQGMEFHGDGQIVVGDMAFVEGRTQLTWGAWIYPTDWGLGGIIGNTVSEDEVMLLNLGTPHHVNTFVRRADGSTIAASHDNALALNAWQHVMATFDGTTVKLYLNGQLLNSGSGAGISPTRANSVVGTVGDSALNRGWKYRGRMDDVRVYQRVLSAGEIAQLASGAPTVVYSATTNGSCPGTITRTWTATDSCGNTTSATQVITVLAREPRDSDGDGLDDSVETGTGKYVSPKDTGTDPNKFDTDGDGLGDGYEVAHGTNPNVRDVVRKAVRNDFDGDRRSDPAVYDPTTTGSWTIRSSAAGKDVAYDFGLKHNTPATGDYDGDGKVDIAMYDPNKGRWYLVKSRDGYEEVNFGYDRAAAVPGDYDGDGRTDIAVFDAGAGMWYMLLSQRGFTNVQFGFEGCTGLSGDFDNDGRDDICVFFGQFAQWYVLGSTAGFTSFQFGFAGTLPVVGDFDGDGYTDAGVYYPKRGRWYLNETSSGFQSFIFGFRSTLPLVGDYDGDGRSDVGIYLGGKSARWYLLQSGLGYKAFQFGNDKTVPIGTMP